MRFLKHLARTRLLLHVVDIAPWDESDPVEAVDAIVGELHLFSRTLAERERWLVLNKLDLLPDKEAEKRCQEIVEELDWQGPVFRISAVNGQGTQELVYEIMNHLEELNLRMEEDEDFARKEMEARSALEEEARMKMKELVERRKRQKEGLGDDDDFGDDDDDDDDEHDMEVLNAPY